MIQNTAAHEAPSPTQPEGHRLLSKAVQRLKPSATNSTTQLARELRAAGRDVIALSVGEPDFDTPTHVVGAATEAMKAGHTRYAPVMGIPELRAAVQRKFREENGLEFEIDQIMVSTGGKQVIANAMLATIDPGDEVVIPAPFWVSYPELVTFCGGSPVIVPSRPEADFLLSPQELEEVLTPKTKWLVLNSPCNPSGGVYGADELAALAETLRRHPQVHVLCDDIYEHLIYSDTPFKTLAAVAPDLADRILTMNGVSKAYAMTGWRIGYAAGPKPLIRAMGKVQGQTTSAANSIAQWAAVAALTGPQEFLAERRESFRRRRDMVVARLNAAPGLHCRTPAGAFYVYASCEGTFGATSPAGARIHDDQSFCQALLEESGVAVVHGTAFGLQGHFRVSYSASDEQLIAACDRIVAFCTALAEQGKGSAE